MNRQISTDHDAEVIADVEGGHEGEVEPVALVSQEDGTLALIDLAKNGAVLQSFKGHRSMVCSMDVNWPTMRAVSTGTDGAVYLWDLHNDLGEELVDLPGRCRCCSRVIIADWSEQPRAVAANDAGQIALWDLSGKKCEKVFPIQLDLISSMAVEWTKLRALVGHGDSQVDLMDLQEGVLMRSCRGHHLMVTCLAVWWSKAQALCGSGDGQLLLWDLRKGEEVSSLKGHRGSITVLTVRWATARAVSGATDNSLRLWDVKKAVCLRVIPGHSDPIRTMSLNWDLGIGLSCGNDGELMVFKLSDTVEGSESTACALASEAEDALRVMGAVVLGVRAPQHQVKVPATSSTALKHLPSH